MIETPPQFEQNWRTVLREPTAGDPLRAEVRGTNLSRKEIGRRRAEQGTPAGKRVLRVWLQKRGFQTRKAHHTLTRGAHPDRAAQFQHITQLPPEFLDAGQPVLSSDPNKKEHWGTFDRAGQLSSREEVRVNDHDFPRSATGTVIPYGIYDSAANRAHLTRGTRHDTRAFACECRAHGWEQHGRARDPHATRLLILCEGGGSHASNRHVFQEELQRLADRRHIEIRVAHDPPYCSQYNPLEHRVFPHVTRACQGVVFESVEPVEDLISRTRTQTGLSVTTSIRDRVFQLGPQVAADFHSTGRIIRDELRPQGNYKPMPTPG